MNKDFEVGDEVEVSFKGRIESKYINKQWGTGKEVFMYTIGQEDFPHQHASVKADSLTHLPLPTDFENVVKMTDKE